MWGRGSYGPHEGRTHHARANLTSVAGANHQARTRLAQGWRGHGQSDGAAQGRRMRNAGDTPGDVAVLDQQVRFTDEWRSVRVRRQLEADQLLPRAAAHMDAQAALSHEKR